jgi:hypothetical protein
LLTRSHAGTKGLLSKKAFGLEATLLLVQASLDHKPCNFQLTVCSRAQPYFTLKLFCYQTETNQKGRGSKKGAGR